MNISTNTPVLHHRNDGNAEQPLQKAVETNIADQLLTQIPVVEHVAKPFDVNACQLNESEFTEKLINISKEEGEKLFLNNIALFKNSPHIINKSISGVTPFFLASYWRLWDLVRFMLECNPNSDTIASPLEGRARGITSLLCAAYDDQWDLVKLMLERNPNSDTNTSPSEGPNKGLTPLLQAAFRQQWDLVKLMLECNPNSDTNASLSEGLNKGRTPLWYAACFNQWELVKLMLECNPSCDINVSDDRNKGGTPLWLAAKYRQWELVKLMLESSPYSDINISPSEGHNAGKTPFWFAVAFQQWDLVKLMLQCNPICDINASPLEGADKGIPPFWYTAYYQQWDIVKLILECNPNCNINVSPLEGAIKGITPFWYAAYYQQWDIVKLMLECNPNCNINVSPLEGAEKGITPFWYAAYYQQWDIVKLMLECNPVCNINVSPLEGDSKGVTPLFWAARCQQWELVKLMLKYNPNSNINTSPSEGPSKGRTPLWIAACFQLWDIVKLMLECNSSCDINVSTTEGLNKGRTPLWFATCDRQWDIVKLMLERSPYSDVNISPAEEPGKGISPLWYAAHYQEWEIVKLMLACNPNIDFTISPSENANRGQTPLYLSLQQHKTNSAAAEVVYASILFGTNAEGVEKDQISQISKEIEHELNMLFKTHQALVSKLDGSLFIANSSSVADPVKLSLVFELQNNCSQIAFLPYFTLWERIETYFKIKRELVVSDSPIQDFLNAYVKKNNGLLRLVRLIGEGTLFHYAIYNGAPEQVIKHLGWQLQQANKIKCLLRRECVEVKTEVIAMKGQTLLHYAASRGDMDMAKYLVSICPRLLLEKDDENLTAGVVANKCKHKELATFLIKASLDVKIEPIKTEVEAEVPLLLFRSKNLSKTASVDNPSSNYSKASFTPAQLEREKSNRAPQKIGALKTNTFSKIHFSAPTLPHRKKKKSTTLDETKGVSIKQMGDQKSLKDGFISTIAQSSEKGVLSIPPTSLGAFENFSAGQITMHAPSMEKAEARKIALELIEKQKKKSELKKQRVRGLPEAILRTINPLNIGKETLFAIQRPEVSPYHSPFIEVHEFFKVKIDLFGHAEYNTMSERKRLDNGEINEMPEAAESCLTDESNTFPQLKKLIKCLSKANLKVTSSINLTDHLIVTTLEQMQAAQLIDYRKEGNTISANKINDHTVCMTIHMHNTTKLWYRKPEIIRCFLRFVQECGFNLEE